jgi:FlaA1/EpsC-like NDP-sugar epimerase
MIHLLWNGDYQLKFQNLRYLPRWIVLVIDSFLIMVSSLITLEIINRLTHSFYDSISVPSQFLFILLSYLVSFFAVGTYSGVIRHSTFVDILKIAIACMLSNLFLAVISYTFYYLWGEKLFLMPFLIINMAITFLSMLFFRLTVKFAYTSFNKINLERRNVLIVDVNDETISLAEAISNSKDQRFKLTGFISLKKRHSRIKILGKPIFRFSVDFFKKIDHLKIDSIIISKRNFNTTTYSQLIDFCLVHNIQIFQSPTIEELQDDTLDINRDIQKIQIEDLLDRNEIKLDDTLIHKFINKKIILITGGAGSIGSEIVRQVSTYQPELIIVFDQAESALHELDLAMRLNFPAIKYNFILGDIRSKKRLEQLFLDHEISIIYHAAAYKHVPLIESHPKEAIQTNVVGTMNLADMAVKHKIDRFVLISTDKAVNPTNVMGASKRAAEIYVQSLKDVDGNVTKFVTTRFGNVLGSNGSVIPHFKRQIELGGPVTVTHKDIIRYFMTIPEACQLVLQAGTMGNGSEIFVFDMGEPVKIVDLAEKMIRLSGLIPYKDIDIQFIGLRPGEKLYEELLTNDSTTLPTHHTKILIANQGIRNNEEIIDQINNIIISAETENDADVVTQLKTLIPEYISENSVYQSLDTVSHT